MSTMGQDANIEALIAQIEKYDEFLAPPQASSEHRTHIQDLIEHLRNIDQANVSQNRKLQFAKEVLEGYLQYEDCVSVLKAVMREIYNPQPNPLFRKKPQRSITRINQIHQITRRNQLHPIKEASQHAF